MSSGQRILCVFGRHYWVEWNIPPTFPRWSENERPQQGYVGLSCRRCKKAGRWVPWPPGANLHDSVVSTMPILLGIEASRKWRRIMRRPGTPLPVPPLVFNDDGADPDIMALQDFDAHEKSP